MQDTDTILLATDVSVYFVTYLSAGVVDQDLRWTRLPRRRSPDHQCNHLAQSMRSMRSTLVA